MLQRRVVISLRLVLRCLVRLASLCVGPVHTIHAILLLTLWAVRKSNLVGDVIMLRVGCRDDLCVGHCHGCNVGSGCGATVGREECDQLVRS